MPNPPADLIQVGRVIGAFGVRGWVRIEPFGEDVIGGAATLWLARPAQPATQNTVPPASFAVQQIRAHGGDYIAQFQGVSDRDAAHALRSSAVFMSRADFAPLPDNEYYWVDLIGCSVSNTQKESLGVILSLEDHGADPVMRIDAQEPDTGKKIVRLIPFVDAYVISVDIDARQVQVDWDRAWDEELKPAAGEST